VFVCTLEPGGLREVLDRLAATPPVPNHVTPNGV
jgi:hypothetical protein